VSARRHLIAATAVPLLTFVSLTVASSVEVVRIVIPEPATRQAILDTYAAALRDHPRARLLLLSHMNNRTGLVLPVRDIAAMAGERRVDVIVDAAHSWGQLDFTIGVSAQTSPVSPSTNGSARH
jgi:selenocysteine lyase/cysteine desulfurase